jgi:pimeloyl-ACP methyl ester carboxylesterase
LAATALAAARDPSTTVLVLVSPAILVPANAAQTPRRPGGAAVAAPWAAAEVRVAGGAVRLVQWWRAGAAAALLRLGLPLLLELLPPLLRSLAYSEAFWRKGLASAVGPEAPETATALPGGTAAASAAERPRERPPSATMVRAYRWPSLCRGWSVGLTRFTAAALAEASAAKSSADGSSGGSNREGSSGSSESKSQGTGSALSELEAAVGRGLAVLVLHGARDAIIPAANSQRLAARLSAAAGARSASAIAESAARASEPPPPCGLVRLVEFAGSGHLPHEEEPEALAEAVAAFVAEARRDES